MSAVNPTGGNKVVAAAGTGVALAASATRCVLLYVRAKTTNTQNIYLGDSSVDKTTSKQIILAADASFRVDLRADGPLYLDLAAWYVDADVNGEGVDFLYLS